MIIVYTTGVFDLLHPGHLNILKRARALGDRLIVGVQNDESVEQQKGKRPTMACADRILMLETLPFVDIVVPYQDIDQRLMLSLIKPDIMVQGEDWLKTGDRTEIIKFLKQNKIRLVQFPYTQTISTTKIKEKIKNDEGN
ncbi:MAG: adenylyltransferase/cytidyltransferase family protein [Candidatus Omnitrophota bacterium]